jgi:Lrp/AsnC family transcriptional regulator for asnA, asnC and gidA
LENNRPDKLDFDIIRQLREDGRRPAKTIAQALGVTEATVTSRIHALSDASVMRVMAQRNVEHLRTRLFCFIRVWIRGRPTEAVADDIAAFPGAGSVMMMVSSPEIHVTALVEDNDDLLALLQDHIGQVSGVDRLDVSMTLKARPYRSASRREIRWTMTSSASYRSTAGSATGRSGAYSMFRPARSVNGSIACSRRSRSVSAQCAITAVWALRLLQWPTFRSRRSS